MCWATIKAVFSQIHPVTLLERKSREIKKVQQDFFSHCRGKTWRQIVEGHGMKKKHLFRLL
jgi:hypothetical protein